MTELHTLATLEDTRAMAVAMARTLRRSDVVALHGSLGVGKTTFAQHLIAALSGATDVTSPTFTLLQTYPVTLSDGEAVTLHHYDLYRVTHAAEFAELGLEDALREVVVIEWPERLSDPSIITYALTFTSEKDGTRHVRVHTMRP